MGIPNDSEHRIININPSKKELQEGFKAIIRKQARHFEDNTPLFLFVYFGGHGVAHKSQ